MTIADIRFITGQKRADVLKALTEFAHQLKQGMQSLIQMHEQNQ